MDFRSQTLKTIPDSDIFTAGFSCKDLSHLNSKRGDMWQQIVDMIMTEATDKASTVEVGGTTAPTLMGTLRYIRNHRPALVGLENVADFVDKKGPDGKSLCDIVTSFMAVLGYMSAVARTDPKEFGIPMSRPRPYALYCHLPQFESRSSTDTDLHAFQTAFRDMLGNHQRAARAIPLSKALIPLTSSVVVACIKLKTKDIVEITWVGASLCNRQIIIVQDHRFHVFLVSCLSA
jgi:site-specific DNA-cytosine methylase